MIAVDTNLLVHAHRADSEWHEPAAACVRGLAEARSPWALPWPSFHEFLAISTHPRIWNPPTPTERALDQVEAWLESPSLVLLTESPEHWRELRDLIAAGRRAWRALGEHARDLSARNLDVPSPLQGSDRS